MAKTKTRGGLAAPKAPAPDQAEAKKDAGLGAGAAENPPAKPDTPEDRERQRAASEADAAAEKAGLPKAATLPRAPSGGVRMNEVNAAGGVTFQLPQPTSGRFAAPDKAAELEAGDEAAVTKRAAELLKEKDRVPAGTPDDRARAARAQAVSDVLAEKALKGLEEQKGKERSVKAGGPEKAQQEKQEGIREQVYKGADFVNNPHAYAADPTNAADRGPAEPIPVDYRRIQDEEGRLAGNFKAPA